MKNINQLFEHIEELSAEVHNAWWREKEKQGFHPPIKCENALEEGQSEKFSKRCVKCHTDMYPYNELPDNIREYDRVTVRSVLHAIEKLDNNIVI